MQFRKIGKALLYPHIAIMLLLVPVSAVLLVGSMVYVGTESVVAYVSYVFAAYTLTVWCFRVPRLIEFFKSFQQKNKYAIKWQEDARLRMNVSLYGTFAYNPLYGIFQIWLGLQHGTFWFLSLGAYYICLAFMRLLLLLHTGRYAPGERMRTELKKYRATGWVFLVMNLALGLIVFFMVYWNRTFEHHMITAIAMAAYTFLSFTLAILNVIKYRKKYQSPVFRAAKAISFASACVSMLTLTSTMLTTFQDGSMDAAAQKLMLGCVGAAVVALVTYMAIYMIVGGTKKLKTGVKNGE